MLYKKGDSLRAVYYKMLWEFHMKFTRGWKSVCIKPTLKCNYKCSYCCVDYTLGRRPIFEKELTPDEWLEVLKPFGKIKKLIISGGEPMVYPHFNELAEKLINAGYYIRILTNLSSDRGLSLPSTYQLFFCPTYHKEMTSQERFERQLKKYRKKFLVRPRGFGGDGYKPIHFQKDNKDRVKEHFFRPFLSPDGRIFGSCIDLERAGK